MIYKCKYFVNEYFIIVLYVLFEDVFNKCVFVLIILYKSNLNWKKKVRIYFLVLNIKVI